MLLDRVLEGLDVDVEPFALCEIGQGSDLTIGGLGWVTMHFVLAGSGEIKLGSGRSVSIGKYSLCLVKRPHVLIGSRGDEIDFQYLGLEGVDHLRGSPSGDPDFVVACGKIQATYASGIALFDLIEDPIVIDFAQSSEMRHLFEVVLTESGESSPGSLGMIRAVMQQCLVIVLRTLSRSGESGLAWVDALADERMAAVIDSIMKRPGDPHTVASMAETAHMSRSAFSTRFRECFNQTPMAFVRLARVRKSAAALRTSSDSVSTIAHKAGFSSRSHFSRVFKAEFGTPPGRFRIDHANGS